MDFAFNELSCTNACPPSKTPHETITEFVCLLKELVKSSVIEHLFLTDDVWSSPHDAAFSLNQWLYHSNTDQDHRNFLLRMIDKYFYTISKDSYNTIFELEINGEKHESLGCLVGAKSDLDIISMASSSCFQVEELHGTIKSISNESEDIEKLSYTLNNIFCCSQINSLLNRCAAEIKNSIQSTSDLWECRKKLFPHLVFCEGVKKHLAECQGGGGNLKQILARLNILEDYFSNYNGIYDHKELGHNARTESDTVKSNRKLQQERLFAMPDGRSEYFYDHISFTGSMEGRIHFYPDPTEKRCYIGYIGKHLGTAKY